MIAEKVFQQILALGETGRVTSVDDLEQERQVTIRLAAPPHLWASPQCPHGERRHLAGSDHAPERRGRPLNVCPWASAIAGALPRGQGRDGRRGVPVRAPWAGRRPRGPPAFEAFARTLMRARPVTKAGAIWGQPDQQRWRRRFAQGDAAWPELSGEDVVGVGADAMNRRKGHNSLTGFVDRQAQRVWLAGEGK